LAELASFTLDWGAHTLLELLTFHSNDFTTVLDVGGGQGEHTRFLKFFGKQASTIYLHAQADFQGDFLTYNFPCKFDAIFCSHVLEHQRNIGLFIEKLFSVLHDDGILALAVPCHLRNVLLSGHITNWNSGLLVYNLVLGGFDCREARIYQGLDVNIVVRKRPAHGGDIGTPSAWGHVAEISQYFPFPVDQGSDCEIPQVNWDLNYRLPPLGRPVHLQIHSRTLGEVNVNLG